MAYLVGIYGVVGIYVDQRRAGLEEEEEGIKQHLAINRVMLGSITDKSCYILLSCY